uniref:adenylate kinase n=1 Tax=Schistocephalus solidus TaxID=70667 RepID=A0A0V0J550_SCHSO
MPEEKLSGAKVIFVLGGPGSGKGTQCENIVKKYGFNHLSSGDLLRAEVASGSPRGNELKAIMEKGELVSLDVVLQLIKDAMIKLVDKNCHFLIDGYPRELEQGTRFESEICKCLCVLVFDVSEEVMRQRLLKRGESSGRADDNAETIINRLKTFNELTKPVIEHYDKENKVVRIDASPSIEEVFKTVQVELEKVGVK